MERVVRRRRPGIQGRWDFAMVLVKNPNRVCDVLGHTHRCYDEDGECCKWVDGDSSQINDKHLLTVLRIEYGVVGPTMRMVENMKQMFESLANLTQPIMSHEDFVFNRIWKL